MNQQNSSSSIKKIITVIGGITAPLVVPILSMFLFDSIRWIAIHGQDLEMILAAGTGLLVGEVSVAFYPAGKGVKFWLMLGYALIVYPAMLMALIWFFLEVLKIKIA